MGGNSSKVKSETNIVNKAMTNVMMKNTSNCKASGGVKQTLNLGKIKSDGCQVIMDGISQNAVSELNFSCVQDSGNDAEILGEFKSELDKELKAQLSGLGINNKSEVDSITNITNDISTNISMENLSECIASNFTDQKMETGDIEVKCYEWQTPFERRVTVKNVNQAAVSKTTATCLQTQKQATESINKLESILKEKAKSKNDGFTLDSLFTLLGLASLLPFLPFLIPLFILLSIASSSSSSLMLGGMSSAPRISGDFSYSKGSGPQFTGKITPPPGPSAGPSS